ncbi:MAG: hypothetical protein ACTSWI_04800 [Alphaproteobacteria bacterium]
MAATPLHVLAERIAALDGYVGGDVPASYDREARELADQLMRAGFWVAPVEPTSAMLRAAETSRAGSLWRIMRDACLRGDHA